ncbi:NAD(P)/FAD-dependent oxidoreductase [Georgenia sp. AZ-5]|uniref:NAD(P)/FAD-dependent oxidoreductase n=1 Tax=Georgenia sp. AZ-5 TaxID=3367526 RepID=UPI0037546C00
MTQEAPAHRMYDVAVVGGGPAGLSAALVLGRARRRVLLVDGAEPRNRCSPSLHGYLTRDGATPADFLATARQEVDGYGVERRTGTVTGLRAGDDGFWVDLGDAQVRARRVVVATGLTDELPDIAGVAGRWGRDVLHCPYCHGYEQRDRPLGVVGGDRDGAVHQALLLRQWSPDVILFLHEVPEDELTARDRALLAARGVRVVPGRVTAVVTEEDRLAGLRLADGSYHPRAAVFVPLRLRVNDAPLAGLDVATTRSDMGVCLATDPEGRTSVPGLWAAGNVAGLALQVIGAAESGARAAIGINGGLVLEDAEAALAGRDAA